jgi:hypothetical protein
MDVRRSPEVKMVKVSNEFLGGGSCRGEGLPTFPGSPKFENKILTILTTLNSGCTRMPKMTRR